MHDSITVTSTVHSSASQQDLLDAHAKDETMPIFPRSAWQSKVSFVKTVFNVKKRLDEIERLAASART